MTMLMSLETFRAAMRLTASGVAIVATDGPAGRAGLTVSSFQSLSLEPPSVMVCIHAGSRNLAAIERNGVFAASVLASHQTEAAEIFAGASLDARRDYFAAGPWRTLVTGAPALTGALCAFDCTIADITGFGSHRILIGAVQAVECGPADPLIYANRAYRPLGEAQRRG